MDVGDEWTYARKYQGVLQEPEGVKLTSVPTPPARPIGDLYVNGIVTEFDQTIDEDYLYDESMVAALEANYTIKTRNYGSLSCECIYIDTETGFMYVDTATGIVVEKYASFISTYLEKRIKTHTWVISWSISSFPENPEEPSVGGNGGIPGYDMLSIIGIIAVLSTVLIVGIKKNTKTGK